MKNIVIIGGGFAGLWAALGAARQVIENEANIQEIIENMLALAGIHYSIQTELDDDDEVDELVLMLVP